MLWSHYADKHRELVALKPDVLVATSTPATAAFQDETPAIPIVFVGISDPVGAGFVANLAHPGGNLTGFINIEAGMGGDGGYSERSGCSLKGRHVISCSGRIRAEHDCGSLDARCNLVQQFQPLAAHSSFDVDKSGKIPARVG